MKRILSILGLISVFSLLISTPIKAIDVTNDVCKTVINRPIEERPVFCNQANQAQSRALGEDGIVTRVMQFIVYIVGVASVIMIIIGGFRYVLSAGDSNGIQGAKNTILYALVGLVVAIFAQTLVTFVLSSFNS